MLLFRQTDERWIKDSMTGEDDFPNMKEKEISARWEKHKNGKRNDTIGRYGCLITALCSAYCEKYNTTLRIPSKGNELMRYYKGYEALQDISNCKPWGYMESNIVWAIAKMVFKIKNIDYYWTGEIDIKHPDYYYIARVPYDPQKIMSGHYCLITGNNPIKYHDTDSGVIRTDWNTRLKDKNGNLLYFMHRIEFEKSL